MLPSLLLSPRVKQSGHPVPLACLLPLQASGILPFRWDHSTKETPRFKTRQPQHAAATSARKRDATPTRTPAVPHLPLVVMVVWWRARRGGGVLLLIFSSGRVLHSLSEATCRFCLQGPRCWRLGLGPRR